MQFQCQAITLLAKSDLTCNSRPENDLRIARRPALGQGLRRVVRNVQHCLEKLLAVDIDESSDGPLHSTLSEREFQIFCRLAQGQGPTKIAADLSLSVKTVSAYRMRILAKMKMPSNADLTYYDIKNNLVD